jgi:hypothetical protein
MEIAIPTLASFAWLIKWSILLALATVTVYMLGAFLRMVGWVLVKIIPILAAVLILGGTLWVGREYLFGAHTLQPRQDWSHDPQDAPQDAPQQSQDAPPEDDRPSPMPQDPPPVEAQP